jgi:hypothetical protein
MKDAALFLVLLAAGFGVGFLWGARTRELLPGATDTSYSAGVLTVRVDAGAALKGGLAAVLGG